MRSLLILLLLLALAGPALGSDGVLEINQACAVQTGCFAGDTPGFPVTISATNSYKLTSNLTIAANVGAIAIDAVNVTLDLGGFSINGPNSCSGYPANSCTFPFGARGILATSTSYHAYVFNGVIQGVTGTGVELNGASSTVENLRVLGNAGHGIWLATTGRAVRCTVIANRNDGILFVAGGFAQDNQVRGNGGNGIWQQSVVGLPPGIASGNLVIDNALYGYYLLNWVLT
jgi:hypothetical protein